MKRPIKENYELVTRYPFLLPECAWRGSCDNGYDYSWTWLDSFPDGWFKVFGMEMLDEIRKDCCKYSYLYSLEILDIKEKYGTLRFYVGGDIPADAQIDKIIDKYEKLSEHYCEFCGEPSKVWNNGGWLTTMCPKCRAKLERGESLYSFNKFEISVEGECSKFFEETYVIEADTYEEAIEKAKDEFIKEKNDDCYDVMSIHHTELKSYWSENNED